MDDRSRERLIVLDASVVVPSISAALDRLHPLGVMEIIGLDAALAAEAAAAVAERAAFRAIESAEGGAILRLGRAPLPPLHDWSGLEPPQPAEHLLRALAALAPGQVLLARVPRTPRMLAPHLDARGVEWATAPRPDGTALVWVKAAG